MSPNGLSNLTIVVVEDHDDARRYLGLFLDRMGVNVVLARNGFEGLEATKDCHPNLVVSDIQMPGMNGFELLREIRAFGPDAGGNVPIIAMTALVTSAERGRILNAGFQACLPKPFTPDKLSEAIVTVLNIIHGQHRP
jgi:CheY-like chemotaxis protein